MKNYCLLIYFLFIVPFMVFGDWKVTGFDGDPYWTGQVDSTDEDINPRADITYVSDPVIVGESAMRVEWGVINDQDWGGNISLRHFHMDSLKVYDFSEYDSLSFWYYNESASDMPDVMHLRFNLCDVSDSENGVKTYDVAETEYWYTFIYILDDEPGWHKVAIPLVDSRVDPNGFELTGWYGIAGNDVLDLDMIKGIQIEFVINASADDEANGVIVLDDITVSSGDIKQKFIECEGHPYWGGQVDPEDDLNNKAIASYISNIVQTGDAALKIKWGVTHDESWGGGTYLPHFNVNPTGVYNCSQFDSVAFWYYNLTPSSMAGVVDFRFSLGDVSNSTNGHYTYNFDEMEWWYSSHDILDSAPGWHRIAIPLIENANGFTRSSTSGIVGNDLLDLNRIKGYQFDFVINSSMDDVANGIILIDDLTFIGEGTSSIKDLPFITPDNYWLAQNYPNPFNAITKIKYCLPEAGFVELKLYNTLGREIKTLINQEVSGGEHVFHFNAGDLSSGVYFYKIKSGDFTQVQKMILLK
jgi:hypothetical protein